MAINNWAVMRVGDRRLHSLGACRAWPRAMNKQNKTKPDGDPAAVFCFALCLSHKSQLEFCAPCLDWPLAFY